MQIFITGGDPLQDLVLTQMPGRRIKVSWTSMYQYVDYRVFINDHRVSTDGIIVPSTLYTTRPVQLNAFYYFRIRGTTKHYWSDVLGPKGILIFGNLNYNTYHSKLYEVCDRKRYKFAHKIYLFILANYSSEITYQLMPYLLFKTILFSKIQVKLLKPLI